MDQYFKPFRPFVLGSNSKSYPGVSLEVLMFRDYQHLLKIRRYLITRNGEETLFYRHLIWLLARGEDRKSEVLCPWCEEATIEAFSVYSSSSGISVSREHISCSKEICLQNLRRDRTRTQALKFSTLSGYMPGADQKQVVGLLRSLFNLPKRLTEEKAFEFFLR
jgi:hypothetical protein